MAVDPGLSGIGGIASGVLGSGTTGSVAGLDVTLMAALSGSIAASRCGAPVVAASTGAPVVLPPVPFAGMTGGTLALSMGGGGGGSASASTATSAPAGTSTTAVAAMQSAPPGQSGPGAPAPGTSLAPLSPPAPGAGAAAPGVTPVGPTPDQQGGGRYEQRWGIAPSMPGGPLPALAWVDPQEIKRQHAASYKEYLEGRDVLKEIYLEYGRIYLQNPDKQLWAGLATHAGSVVLVEMYDQIERQQQAWLSWDKQMSDLCDRLQRLIVTMAKAIRDDVGTQSAVFGAEGIDGIRRLGLAKKNVEAWEAIDDGDVVTGARYLAQREQTDVLNKYYADMAEITWALKPAFSWNAISGLEEFGCPTFNDALGAWPLASWMDTDPADQNDRWKYIRDSILPVWVDMGSDGRTDWVKRRLDVIRNSQEIKYDGF